jgi:hypothetical protein
MNPMPTMPEEFRRKTMEGWEKAKADKLKRRAENREKWAKRREWSDDNQHTVEAEVSIEPNGEGSASLQQLRALMANPSVPLYRRLDCAEVILSYELGPAAAVGADPDMIAAGSYRFLKEIAATQAVPEALRFRALKSIVAVENARASITNTAANDSVKRHLWLALLNATRSARLRREGHWPPPDDSWALTIDDVELPQSWRGQPWPPVSFAAALEEGDTSALKAELTAMAERSSATKPQKP